MKPFLDHDFLLNTDTAKALYHDHARHEPIYDYHCHLPPEQIADNHRFSNLFEIWLAGDHYKWRAMRSNGVEERFCTGDADPFEKFMAFARTVPRTLRNPLYHWTHLELQRYFDIHELLNEHTARAIWDEANRKMAEGDFSTHAILHRQRVSVVCTTDDPTDDLSNHRKIWQTWLKTKVYPTFRPDKALRVDDPALFNDWVDRLEVAAGMRIHNFGSFLDALAQRHQAFHEVGCRLSDHGLEHCYAEPCDEDEARVIFKRVRQKAKAADPADHARFATFMMVFFGRLDAARGWTKQLHLGAMRNNNTRLFRKLGPDTGFDSIGDFPQARALAGYLDLLDQTGELPKVILYNLNPADNYLMASMIGNFQDGSIPGKIQFGSGWWFLDQKEGMTWQINALSHLGLLSRFVGMLTDSRSFLSFPRHEYFRRILCSILGDEVERGELPNDMDLLSGMVRDICFRNAVQYFGLEIGHV